MFFPLKEHCWYSICIFSKYVYLGAVILTFFKIPSWSSSFGEGVGSWDQNTKYVFPYFQLS
jgi:hypothetical protein